MQSSTEFYGPLKSAHDRIDYSLIAILAVAALALAVVTHRRNVGARREEEALRRSEERFQSLARNAFELVTVSDADGTIVPVITAPGGTHPRRNGQKNRNQERSDRQLQSVGVALDEQFADTLVVADGDAQVAVQDALPVVQVLLSERKVEAVGMSRGLEVGGWRAFSEHLLNGVAGHQVDQEKNKRDHQPEDGQGVEDAG